MIGFIVLFITNSLLATDVPQASVASKTAQSSFEARKERARKKQESEQKKHAVRLEKARQRVEKKGLVPKTLRKTESTDDESTETASITPQVPVVTSTFANDIQQIVDKYMKTSAQPNKPLDPDYFDVIWDENASSLENIIKELESLETDLSQAIQTAKTAKKSVKLKDKEQIQDVLINIESFADDTYQFDSEGNPVQPYAGVKKPYKTRLQALSNNISNVRADLF